MRSPRSLLSLTAVIAVIALTGWLYFWWVGQNLPQWVLHGAGGYNSAYAESVRHGHVYLQQARPEMAKLEDPYDPAQYAPYYVFDLSYYNGYIYSYFSIVPALVLYLPWNLITGTHLSEQFGAGFFMTAGFALSVWLLLALRRRYLPQAPWWTLALGVAVIALGNLSLLLFWPPFYSQVIQGCARLLQVATLAALFLAMQRGRRAGVWLAVASLTGGLAVVSRPIFLPALLMLIPVWRLLVQRHAAQNKSKLSWLPLTLSAIIPVALVGTGQMVLNYVRFDSPLEFGTTYQQFGEDLRDVVQFSLSYIPGHVFEHLFHGLTRLPYFPFFVYQGEPVGALRLLPFSWLILLLPLGVRVQTPENRAEFRALAWALVIAPAGVLLMLSCYYLALVRHQVDFVMPFSLAAAVGLMSGAHAWTEQPVRRRFLAAIAVCLTGVNIFVTLCFGASIVDQPELPRLARVMNTPVYLWEKITGKQPSTTVQLEVVLPENRVGQYEVLAYSGVGPADYVFVRYVTATRATVGYSHAELGTIESDAFDIAANRHHSFTLTWGAFAPPSNHPAFSGWQALDVIHAQHRMQVQVDGKTVLDQDTQFHPTAPADNLVGRVPKSSTLPAFSGVILKTKREALAAPPARLADWPGAGVAFSLTLPNRRLARSDPIVSAGQLNRGDVFFVTYLSEDRVQFGISHWHLGRVLGETITVPPGTAMHPMEIRIFPAAESTHKVVVTFDGKTVLTLPEPLYASPTASVFFGFKSFSSPTEPIFGGRIDQIRAISRP